MLAGAIAVFPMGAASSQAATSSGSASDGGAYPFTTSSFWRSSIASAPTDPNSAALIAYLNASIVDRYSGVAAFNAHRYDSPLYTVDASTPRVEVQYSNCQHKAKTPSGLFGVGGQFEDVPIPASAVAASGTDAEISFYSPSTAQLWEFW